MVTRGQKNHRQRDLYNLFKSHKDVTMISDLVWDRETSTASFVGGYLVEPNGTDFQVVMVKGGKTYLVPDRIHHPFTRHQFHGFHEAINLLEKAVLDNV